MNKVRTRKCIVIVGWLVVWQLVSLCLDNAILMVGPAEVAGHFLLNIVTLSFWKTVGFSMIRILGGFLLAFLLGIGFAVLAYHHVLIKEILQPFLTAIKSIPVASFVVLLLIWFGAENLAFFIVLLIVLPNMYFQVLQGLQSADKKLLEMAQIYHLPPIYKAWYVYKPALVPFLEAGSKIGIGLAWKSGVAAEVIGLTNLSVGEAIYMSKIYLDTAGLFSWTCVCVLLSYICEKVFLKLLRRLFSIRLLPASEAFEKKNRNIGNLVVEKLYKKYDNTTVLGGVSIKLKHGRIYAMSEPSGAGKTTLLRILSELEQADAGEICLQSEQEDAGTFPIQPYEVSFCFQEDRLLLEETLYDNLNIACGLRTKEEWNSLLGDLLPEESLGKPLYQYSGGMKRRAEVARAMLAQSDIVLLDEPFNGIDYENLKRTVAFIKAHQNGRTILFTTHKAEEIDLLSAEIIRL